LSTPGREADPEQAKELGISESASSEIMLAETVDKERTTVETPTSPCSLPPSHNALTG
jgi:hypothetical protein